MAPITETLGDVRDRVWGTIILPGDQAYEGARTVWNARSDHHPALIVRAAGVHDVQAAIATARERDLPLAVRSGGHSMAGHGTVEGGVLLDVSPMARLDLDPVRRIARIEPGLTWGAVAGRLHAHGLALTAGDTATVGVGGLTLGGGIGWMARKYGLTIDHLRSVELVTAEGKIITASAGENAELFWGLRGGGGNFGVATAFEFSLDPVAHVLGGAVFYDAADAEEVLAAYAAYAATAPDELTTMALMMEAPPAPFIPPDKQGLPIVAIAVCYTADLAQGERVVAPLRRLAAPIVDMIAPMPYPSLFALTASAEQRGFQHSVRSSFMERLESSAIHALVAETAATMSPGTLVQLRVLGGAMARVDPDATAFAHRDKPFMVMIANYGPDPAGAARRDAATEQVWRTLQPYAAGVYANFLAAEGEARIREAYPTPTYARLAALKAAYDPTNLFQLNQNITPASRRAAA
jgi:FAD/FMN-containing dehydrogenase